MLMGKVATIILILVSISFAQDKPQDTTAFPDLKGPYLGQKPPRLKPELFAVGIIPTEGVQHCFPTFSPDGKEVYWMTLVQTEKNRRMQIMFMAERNGRWTSPQCAPFSGEYSDHAPFYTADGQRLYFASNRPGGFGKGDIWYVEKTDTGWSEAVNIGSPPNSPESETQPSLTKDGTLYFVCSMDSVKWNRGIYRSRLVDGKYTEPEALGSLINTEEADIYPFIAPDESYLLFGSGRPGRFSTETDLYISFRKDDGSWTEPVNMGQAINNGSSVSFVCLTSDGKYIFFNRFNEGTDVFYWIDSKIIDRYRPAKTD